MTESRKAEVNRVAKLLMDAWAKAEPNHNVTKYPASYVATFADMARAVVEDRLARESDLWNEIEKRTREILKRKGRR